MIDLLTFGCCGADIHAADGAPKDYQSGKPTQLFMNIETQNWDSAIAIVRQNPAEAKKWVVKNGLGGLGGSKRLPIHEACVQKPTDAIISALIKANPMGVREKDSDGQLPLHHAVENGASVAVVEELLLSCPDALDVKNKWGNYPEDIAISTASKEVVDAVKKRPSLYAVKAYKKVRTLEEDKMKDEFDKLLQEERLRSLNTVKEVRADEQRKSTASMSEITQKLAKVSAERDEANAKISSTDGAITKLKWANSEIYAEKKAADQHIVDLKDKNAKLEKVAEGLRAENGNISAKVSSLERQVETLRHVNERLVIENTEYKTKVDKMLVMFNK